MRRRNEGGFALLLTLLVMTILIVLIAQMSITALHTKTISENYVNDLQNSYGARAGYHYGVLHLQADSEKAPNVDHLGEKWAAKIPVELGKSRVEVAIEDSERRINLSHLNKDDGTPNPQVVAQLRRLCSVLQHPPEVANRIIDYVDKDTKGDYELGARNERLYTLEELLRIEGIPPQALYGGDHDGRTLGGLLDYVTLWPREMAGTLPGVVNLNTAPKEVLRALSDDLTSTVADAIVAWRESKKSDGTNQTFETVNDVKKVQGVTDELYADLANQTAVRGSHFEIRVRASVGNLSKRWLYVVKRTTGEQGKIELVTSQRVSDFLAFAPTAEPK